MLDKSNDNEEMSVVAFDAEKDLEAKGIPHKTSSNYIPKEERNRWDIMAIEMARSLGSKKFNDNKHLIKFLEYNKTSLWWFVNANFYRYHLKHVIRLVETLFCIIDQERPKKVTIIDDKSVLSKTVIAVCEAKGIPMQPLPMGWCLWSRIILNFIIETILLHIKPQLRKMRGFLRYKISHFLKKDIIHGDRKIFLASMGRESIVADPVTGERKVEDSVLNCLVKELSNDKATKIVFLYKSLGRFGLKLPKEAYNDERVNYKPWEWYLSPKIRRNISFGRRVINEKWRWLKKDSSFKAIFNYKGVDLWKVCKKEIERLFILELPIIIEYIELSKEILRIEKPDIIVVASEISKDNKALVLAGNFTNTPVLAVQHGFIFDADDYLIDYSCTEKELYEEPFKESIFPQKFAIYGDATKNILLKEIKYPFKERIEVTGQPRYDDLIKKKEVFDKKRICIDWGIDPTKRIVLIGSQTFHVAGNKESFCRSIILALKDNPQLQIVIKPHPSEHESWYRRLANEIGAKLVILPPKSDILKAIFVCDVLVTFYSTVALDAVVLGRPVVTINLTGNPDPIPYARDGVAIGVYKENDIALAIKEVLENPTIRRRLELAREGYLKEHLYRLDGNATKRVVDLINAIIEEKRLHG
jgi:hypothetical protein